MSLSPTNYLASETNTEDIKKALWCIHILHIVCVPAHYSFFVFLPANVAMGKPATQRDDLSHTKWKAHNAVDGDRNGVMLHNTGCMHTGEQPDSEPAWWKVDLLHLYYIKSVTIYNRHDCCAG